MNASNILSNDRIDVKLARRAARAGARSKAARAEREAKDTLREARVTYRIK